MPQQNGCLGVQQLGRSDAEVGVNVGPRLVGPLLSIGLASHAASPSATLLVVMFEGQLRQLGKHLHLPGDLLRGVAPHGRLADEAPVSAPTAHLPAKLATLFVCLVLLGCEVSIVPHSCGPPCVRPTGLRPGRSCAPLASGAGASSWSLPARSSIMPSLLKWVLRKWPRAFRAS